VLPPVEGNFAMHFPYEYVSGLGRIGAPLRGVEIYLVNRGETEAMGRACIYEGLGLLWAHTRPRTHFRSPPATRSFPQVAGALFRTHVATRKARGSAFTGLEVGNQTRRTWCRSAAATTTWSTNVAGALAWNRTGASPSPSRRGARQWCAGCSGAPVAGTAVVRVLPSGVGGAAGRGSPA
jgi:hypothetical protein